jgi:medium-chain acyl-[acyl-carrier-protein] hydrolase
MLDQQWFHMPRPCPDAALRLYCFHHAGGGAAAYRGWPEAVGTGIEIVAVRLPGRENRFAEPRFRRMADVIEALRGPLRADLDRPYAFFGHSLGALVAYETALMLARDAALQPAHLFVAASPFPDRERPGSRDSPIHALPDGALIERLREYGGLSGAVLAQRGLLGIMLPTIRDDLEIGSTYRAPAPAVLSCPVTALSGADDRTVSEQDIVRWRAATSGPFHVRVIRGGHFFATEAVADTAETVLAALGMDP